MPRYRDYKPFRPKRKFLKSRIDKRVARHKAEIDKKYGTSAILANNAKSLLEKKSTLSYNGVSALPNAFRTRFRWSWISQLSTTVQGISAALGSGYRVNSIYDPDAGAGGHQPLFRDQLVGNLFQRYRVIKCVAQVIFTNPTNDSMVCGCRLRIGGVSAVSSGLNEDYLREQTRTTFKTIQTGTGNRVVYDITLPVHKVFGCSAVEVLTDDGYASTAGNSPANQIYLDPWAITRNAAVGSVDVSVNMLYFTELDQLLQPAQS